MVKEIPLTRGKVALVDDEDYERIASHKWHCSHYGYAIRFVGKKVVWMHREVLPTPIGYEPDHISRDRLDNRKSNLRPATRAENSRSQPCKTNNTSGVPGVGFHKRSGKWRAYLRLNYTQMERLCNSFEEAKAVRAEMESKYFGEFAPSLSNKHS